MTNKIKILIAIFCFLSIGIHAQTKSIENKLNKTNHIEIRFFKGRPNKSYITSKHIDLLYLKALITQAKNTPDLKCDTTGEIIYFMNKVQLFKAYFSSRGSGSKYTTTGGVIFKIGSNNIKSLLNYGSGMLINEIYYQLQKHN